MRPFLRNLTILALIAGLAMAVHSCGGGGGSAPPPAPTYSIGGTVSGLSGTGLVLQNNGADDLGILSSGTFTFATNLSSGASYSVTVKTHPTALTQTCTVTSGSGTVAAANVTGVLVSCATRTYSVGGTVSGLIGTGLTLLNNGGNSLVASNGTFTFSTWIAEGALYSVTVGTQPTSPAQTCLVTSGSGTMATAPVTNVAVACPALANGTVCSADGNCLSGVCECADGSCTTKVCSAVSCDCKYVNGEGSSCAGNLALGTDPRNVCLEYVCNGSGACKTSCTTAADCDSDNTCAAPVCVARSALGVACAANSDCGSTFCSFAVCCESACAWGTGCSSGLCTGSVATAPCTADRQCASGICSGGVCN